MSENKEDLHIAILKYGRDKLESGISFDELCSHIKDKGYDVGKQRLNRYFWENYEEVDRTRKATSEEQAYREQKMSLTVESTFRLIEHEEFQSANINSRNATLFASAALSVSIIAAVASIYFSMKQLNTATIINQDQLTSILSSKYDTSNIEKQITELVKQQSILNKKLEKAIIERPKISNTTDKSAL